MKRIYVEIILVLVIGAGAFFGGMKYQQSKTPAPSARFAGAADLQGAARFRNGQLGAQPGTGFITGQIISLGAGSLTIQIPNNGGSKIVLYSSTTPIMKTTEGTASDLTSGANVQVTGKTNTDGSVTAQSIQLRPQTPPTQAAK